MGICLSCLRPELEDEQLTENTPLLNDTVSDADKEAKLRKRQEELDRIVNETNEQLIDVTTFFNANSSTNNNTMSGSTNSLPTGNLVRKPLNGQLQDKSQLTELQLKAISNFSGFTDEELQQYNEFNEQLLKQVQQEIKITPPGPLLTDFN